MLGECDDCVGGVEQAEWMYSSGIKLSLCQAVIAWQVQPATLSTAPVSGTLDCLDRIADLSPLLLRQCEGSVKQLTSVVGPLAPHVQVEHVKHWFGDVKQFPHIDRLLRALSSGVPVDVAQGGHLRDVVEYGNHPSVRGHADDIAKKVATYVKRVVRWCSTQISLMKFKVSVCPRWVLSRSSN